LVRRRNANSLNQTRSNFVDRKRVRKTRIVRQKPKKCHELNQERDTRNVRVRKRTQNRQKLSRIARVDDGRAQHWAKRKTNERRGAENFRRRGE
jgi:hypothetical protein